MIGYEISGYCIICIFQHLRSFICRILQAHLTLTSFENKKSSHLEKIGQIIFNVLPLREACADTVGYCRMYGLLYVLHTVVDE